jgi:hypothetical protein
MPFTQADVDRLDRAIADGCGARSMTFDGQTVTFGSPEDFRKLRAIMLEQIAAAAGTRRSFRVATTSKGV